MILMRRVLTPDAPFVGGTAFDGSRPLRIVLDDALGSEEAGSLLRGFARHGLVEVFAQGDDHYGPLLIVSEDLDEQRNLHYELRRATSTERRSLPYAQQYRNIAPQMVEDYGAASEDDAYRALILAQIARDLGADAFATRSDFVLERAPRGLVEKANPMTPNEALALMGLYLRLRGDFTTFMDSGFTYTPNRGLWYWVLTRDMLRSGWRWFSACVHSATATGDDTLTFLGQSALRRFDRALRARDRVLQQFHLPPNNDTSDEGLFNLEVVLLMLSGALDAAAHVAEVTYSLGTKNPASVGWRKMNWRDSLRELDTAFDPLLDDESEVRDVIDLVGLLRNTIHGAALQGIAYQEHSKPRTRENLVLLPEAERERILAAVDRRGGHNIWGIRPLWGDEVGIEGDTFLEALVPAVAKALNNLMDATDVEGLPEVSAADLSGPPTESKDLFSPWHSRLHRLLAGLA